MDVKNKVIIVTGASSGIGLATAQLLNKLGAQVALVARSSDKLTEISRELPGSFARPADMTNKSEVKVMVQEIFNHYGKIDVLVNNAGQGYDAPIEKINIKTFYHIFDLDVVGPLIAMQQVIPIMKKQGGGSIVNISSGTALMHLPEMGAYAATKAMLAHLSLTARQELKKFNITVSVVYPYLTLTDFENNTIKESAAEIENEQHELYQLLKSDSAEFAAQRVIEAIRTGNNEVFAHAWMKQSDQRN